MTTDRLTQKEIAFFFLPLLLNVQLMSVSHTVINSALARLDDYVTALAGMSVALVVHLFVASPSYQNHTVTIAMVRGRNSMRSVLVFVLLVAGYCTIMLSLIAFTPLGDLILIRVMGAPPEVAQAARKALYLLVLLPFFTGFRGFFQGLIIQARRTSLVSIATGVRVGGLFGFLALGREWFSGAQLGAFALVSCVITETIVSAYFAWRVHLSFGQDEVEKKTGDILRYSFPLAYSSCLQQTIPLLISSIIGRLSDGPLALAAFGVIRGFLFLLAGPMRNLQQVYLTLVKSNEDYRTLIRFNLFVATGMGVLVLLTAGPLNKQLLGDLLGVEPELRHYLRYALGACALFPILYGTSNLLRGWFAGAHQTGKLGHSTGIKSGFLMLVWFPIVALQPPISGVAIGIGLLLCAESLEAVYLRLQKQRQPKEVRELAPR
ncbi:MAG TPA: hypothetical protein VJ974_04190 [Geopsychrobacteraceae bacterium]|nr:hypothetical protein [Geopsychrobacteraceae bacterium]